MMKFIFALTFLLCLSSFSLAQQGIENGQSKGDGKYQRLEILSKPRAVYTKQAKKDKVEGTVRLRVVFNPDKTIGDIEIIKELPDGLTETAVKAAKKIKFIPAMLNGVPISKTYLIEYNFSL